MAANELSDAELDIVHDLGIAPHITHFVHDQNKLNVMHLVDQDLVYVGSKGQLSLTYKGEELYHDLDPGYYEQGK